MVRGFVYLDQKMCQKWGVRGLEPQGYWEGISARTFLSAVKCRDGEDVCVFFSSSTLRYEVARGNIRCGHLIILIYSAAYIQKAIIQ